MSAALPWPGRSGVKQRNSGDRSATWVAHCAPVRRVAWRKTIAGCSSAPDPARRRRRQSWPGTSLRSTA